MNSGAIFNPEGYQLTPEADDVNPLLGNPLRELIRVQGINFPAQLMPVTDLAMDILSADCGECGQIRKLVGAGNMDAASKVELESPRLSLVGGNIGTDDPDCYLLEVSHQWKFVEIQVSALRKLRVLEPKLLKHALMGLNFTQYSWTACNQNVVGLVRVTPDFVNVLQVRIAMVFGVSTSLVSLSTSTLAFMDNVLARRELAESFNLID